MKLKVLKNDRIYFFCVIVFTLLIVGFLAVATYYINYWPTDSENPYLPTAARLFKLPFLSYMHYLPETRMLQITMRAKETLILGIAIMQKLLNDTQSLYPNVLLLILATGGSALLVYQLARKLFGNPIGFIAFLLFTFSFWPYLYILQGSHPPLVLFNFLLSVFFITKGEKKTFYFLSGVFLGFMLFSSPTSPLYLPYFLTALCYFEFTRAVEKKPIKKILINLLLLSAGAVVVFILFTLPRPLFNLKQYINFLQFSRRGNNFVIYRDFLSQFIPLPPALRGAGWVWIAKYFFLIMPILFLSYLLSLIFLFKSAFRKPALFLVIALSLSTPVFVEIIRVAQFGRNYFSWFIGIIFLVCYAAHSLNTRYGTSLGKKHSAVIKSCVVLLMFGYIVQNGRIFFDDVFPSRMATTNIYFWAIKKHTNEFSTYKNHPRQKNMVDYFNNTKLANKVYFWSMNTIRDVKKGFILIPSISGKTIWCECREGDFKGDPYLTELYASGEFDKYVVARFKTMSSSKIWTQEEEICTYRDLIIGDISPQDRQKGYAWILDAEKLQREWFSKK